MSENFKIGNYTCESQAVYSILSDPDLNLSDAELEKIDKSKDKIITEDELVEFSELEEDDDVNEASSTSGGLLTTEEMGEEYSDDARIRDYQIKRDQEIKNMRKYNIKLKKANVRLKAAEANAAGYAEDSDARSKADSYVSDCESKVKDIKDKISSCTKNILNYNAQIEQIEAQLAAAAQAAANNISSTETTVAANDGTTSSESTANASGTSSNFTYTEGSGAELANVTGDLSICLYRMASSLGTDRASAADYVATLCKNQGLGYFDPKIIVSLVFSESSGDNSASSDPNYVGFGQMSAVAVEEINNQFGTSFTFSDMYDPAKNLEAIVYLLRFQYERYDHNLGKALTAYNVGNCESGNINYYAQQIMSRV